MEKEELITILNEDPIHIGMIYGYFNQMQEADIADVIENLSKERLVRIFRFLPKQMAALVFSYCDSDDQQIIIEALSDREIGDIMNSLFVDDAVDVIEEMPANVIKRLLRTVPSEKRNLINQILQYPEDSAGSIMTTEYVDLSERTTVSEAFGEIRKTGINKETIYTNYVVTPDSLLVGIVSAKDLMLADPEQKIGDIMEPNFVFAYTVDDQEAVATLFKRYGLLALPVVDKERRLVGIITVDDVVKVIEEENTEDFEKMAALNPSEEPYLKTSVLKLTRNRIVWLFFLMLSAAITGSIITGFEDALAVLPILVAFIPMLMDTGGNAGAQTSTLIIRGMALGEIQFSSILPVLWKEIRIGLLCGLGLGAVNFLRIYFMQGKNLFLAATVTLSLMVTIVMAKSMGCILPMVAKKLKVDPAIMAAPLITTIVDGASLAVYLSMARLMFGL
jgi:magnesium transporter